MRSPSIPTLKVLRALLERPEIPQYGLELIERSGVSAGSLYPILSRLEDDGFVVGTWETIDQSAECRRRRRYYQLTAVGEGTAIKQLRQAVADLRPPHAPTRRCGRAGA